MAHGRFLLYAISQSQSIFLFLQKNLFLVRQLRRLSLKLNKTPFMIRVYRRPKAADCLRWSHATTAGMEKRDGCSFLHFVLLNCEIQKRGVRCSIYQRRTAIRTRRHDHSGLYWPNPYAYRGNIAALALRMSQGEPQRPPSLDTLMQKGWLKPLKKAIRYSPLTRSSTAVSSM